MDVHRARQHRQAVRRAIPRRQLESVFEDANVINSWRASTLNEYRDRDKEAKSKAFDRYINNINLLEDALGIKSNDPPSLNQRPGRGHVSREHLREMIRWDTEHGSQSQVVDEMESERRAKPSKVGIHKRVHEMDTLWDKLSHVQNEEDLKACRLMRNRVFNHEDGHETSDEDHVYQVGVNLPNCPSQVVHIEDDATLRGIDAWVSSMEQIKRL